MKAVLLKISAKERKSIITQKATALVRKTCPNLKPPFTVYICCEPNANGKVVGEFTCKEISEISYVLHNQDWDYLCKNKDVTRSTGLSIDELAAYLGKNNGFVWDISDVVVYPEPRELTEFYEFCDAFEKMDPNICGTCKFFVGDNPDIYVACCCGGNPKLSKAPTAWCYVMKSRYAKEKG